MSESNGVNGRDVKTWLKSLHTSGYIYVAGQSLVVNFKTMDACKINSSVLPHAQLRVHGEF